MTTENKKKLFWIAGIAVAVLYFAPRFIRFGPPLPNGGRPVVALPTPPNPNVPPARPNPSAPNGLPAGSTAATVTPQPLPFDNLVGTWQGVSPSGQSLCTLKFELRRKTDVPDKYAGFPELACMSTSQLASGTLRRRGMPLLPDTHPLSAILTGSAANGSITFTVDKSIAASSDECSLTSFTVTPFGASEISAEWQTGTCEKPQHGQMMLRRVGN